MAMPHIDAVTVEELRELMEDDFDILVETYLHDSNVKMGELKSALSAGDAEKVRSIAHSLKGSSSNIGAPAMSELSAKIEDHAKKGDVESAQSVFPEAEAEYQGVVTEFNKLIS